MTALISRDFLQTTDTTINVDVSLPDGQIPELPPFIPAAGVHALEGIDEGAMEHFREAGLLTPSGEIDWDAYAKVPCMKPPYGSGGDGETVGNNTWREIFDTNTLPYRWCAYLLATYANPATGKDESYRGSASMIGPHQVITCAHTISGILEGQTKMQWAKKVTVAFAQKTQNGKVVQPYGARQTTTAWVTVPWFHGGRHVPSEDWGLLEFNLKDLAFGLSIGYFGLRLTGADLVGKTVALTGYPSFALDKKDLLGQWTAEGLIDAFTNGNNSYSRPDYEYQHLIPSAKGDSGGPLHYGTYAARGVSVENAYVFAVHSGGHATLYLSCPINSTCHSLVDTRRKLSQNK